MSTQYPWSLTGKVIRKFAPEPKEGKQQFCSLTLTYQVYRPSREGEGERQPVYVDAISFGKTAEAMLKIDEGKVISVAGEPRATAYLNDDDEPIGKIQVVVDRWAYTSTPSEDEEDEEEAPVRSKPQAKSGRSAVGAKAAATKNKARRQVEEDEDEEAMFG